MLVETPWYIAVDGDGTATLNVTYTMASAAGTANSFYIENEPGVVLPNTGGPGTTLIYLIGILLTGIASAGFVMQLQERKKKRDAA